MAYQLIFTSVPSGLKPGTSGYTTAAHTRDMPDELVTGLEGISGYDHLATRDASFGGRNPSIFRYQILQLNCGTFFVMSRLEDAGADHTGRTNYLAQHLVLESYEIQTLQQYPRINPAGILKANLGDWLWRDPNAGAIAPQYLGPIDINTLIGHLAQSDANVQLPATAWTQYVKNPAAAPSLLEDGRQNVCAIQIEPGYEQYLLHLYAETLAVAVEAENVATGQKQSPQEAWRYTFNTFLQERESYQEYVWCGYVGSLVNQAVNAGLQPVNIFAGHLPASTNERLVSFAETGQEPYVEPEPEPEIIEEEIETEHFEPEPEPKKRSLFNLGKKLKDPSQLSSKAPEKKKWDPSKEKGRIGGRKQAGAGKGGGGSNIFGTPEEAARFQAGINANASKKAARNKKLTIVLIILIPILTLAALYFSGVIGGDSGAENDYNSTAGLNGDPFGIFAKKKDKGPDNNNSAAQGGGGDPQAGGNTATNVIITPPSIGSPTNPTKPDVKVTRQKETPEKLRKKIESVFGEGATNIRWLAKQQPLVMAGAVNNYLYQLADKNSNQDLPIDQFKVLTVKYGEGFIKGTEPLKVTNLKKIQTYDIAKGKNATAPPRISFPLHDYDENNKDKKPYILYTPGGENKGTLEIKGAVNIKKTTWLEIGYNEKVDRFILLASGDQFNFEDSLVRTKNANSDPELKIDDVLHNALKRTGLVPERLEHIKDKNKFICAKANNGEIFSVHQPKVDDYNLDDVVYYKIGIPLTGKLSPWIQAQAWNRWRKDFHVDYEVGSVDVPNFNKVNIYAPRGHVRITLKLISPNRGVPVFTGHPVYGDNIDKIYINIKSGQTIPLHSEVKGFSVNGSEEVHKNLRGEVGFGELKRGSNFINIHIGPKAAGEDGKIIASYKEFWNKSKKQNGFFMPMLRRGLNITAKVLGDLPSQEAAKKKRQGQLDSYNKRALEVFGNEKKFTGHKGPYRLSLTVRE